MRINTTKVKRDLSGPLHRMIRQGVGTPWAQLHRELKEYADSKRLPRWQLRKAIQADVVLSPIFNDDGHLVDGKDKPMAPGTLYVSPIGVLTKWLTPPAPVEEDEFDDGYEQIPHPDHLTIETEDAGWSQTRWVRGPGKRGSWGRGYYQTVKVKRKIKFYLERREGIWYESKYELSGWGQRRWERLVYRHQLNRSNLRRLKLENDRAA